MDAALADVNFAFEEVNPQSAKTHRSMWYRRIFSHKFLREIPRDCAVFEIAQSLRTSASRMAMRSASSMLPRNPRLSPRPVSLTVIHTFAVPSPKVLKPRSYAT